MDDDYTTERLQEDIWRMVTIGLLDIAIRDDGEWVYSISHKAASMTAEEREALLDEASKLEYPFNN